MSKFKQFIKNIQNQAVEVSDKSNIYQCMDFAYLWLFVLGFPKATIQNLYAYQAYTKPKEITKQYFDIIKNTPDAIPQAGDLVVWDTSVGVAGHIAVATGKGNTSSFESLDQNWNGVQRVTVTNHTYSGVLGWLRPKAIPSDACLIGTDDTGKALFSKLVHNSDVADQVVRKLELGQNADAIAFETIEKSLAARDGKLTQCQNLLATRDKELAGAVAEVANRTEQVSRLKDELTAKDKAHLAEITALKQSVPNVDEATKPLKAEIEQLTSTLKEEAKAKGNALRELAEAKKELENAQNNVIGRITFRQWLKLFAAIKW